MRRLLMALALGFGFTAMAQGGTSAGSGSGNVKSDAQQIGSDINRVGSDVGQTAKSGAQEAGKALGLSPDQTPLTEGKAFSLAGTVKSAGGNKITIAREGLPPATLDIRKQTQVTLNGQPWQSKDLPEGLQVRTKFQLDGGTPVAVTVEATQTPGSQP